MPIINYRESIEDHISYNITERLQMAISPILKRNADGDHKILSALAKSSEISVDKIEKLEMLLSSIAENKDPLHSNFRLVFDISRDGITEGLDRELSLKFGSEGYEALRAGAENSHRYERTGVPARLRHFSSRRLPFRPTALSWR